MPMIDRPYVPMSRKAMPRVTILLTLTREISLYLLYFSGVVISANCSWVEPLCYNTIRCGFVAFRCILMVKWWLDGWIDKGGWLGLIKWRYEMIYFYRSLTNLFFEVVKHLLESHLSSFVHQRFRNLDNDKPTWLSEWLLVRVGTMMYRKTIKLCIQEA